MTNLKPSVVHLDVYLVLNSLFIFLFAFISFPLWFLSRIVRNRMVRIVVGNLGFLCCSTVNVNAISTNHQLVTSVYHHTVATQETAATTQVQHTITKVVQKTKYSSHWGCPVQSRRVDSETYGTAAGVAVFCITNINF